VLYVLLSIFILLEIILGLCFIFYWSPKIKKISISLLIFFITFAIYLWLGNVTNCGCFGTTITVSPLSTVVKNVVLIILIKRIY
jgi:hypothetical protein